VHDEEDDLQRYEDNISVQSSELSVEEAKEEIESPPSQSDISKPTPRNMAPISEGINSYRRNNQSKVVSHLMVSKSQ